MENAKTEIASIIAKAPKVWQQENVKKSWLKWLTRNRKAPKNEV